MRGLTTDYEMKTPKNIKEALQILSTNSGEWQLFAGGTDLMVSYEAGKLTHKKFLNINALHELKGFVVNDQEILIGGGCTFTQIKNHPIIQQEFPLLVNSAEATGAFAIQNRATIGGNIANMSPAADTPPVLLAYNADLILLSSKGYRIVNYTQFHKGYKRADLRADEIIMAIKIHRHQGISHSYYRKVGTRAAQSISKVCLAGVACVFRGQNIEWIQIGLGSVAPIPMQAIQTEHFLNEKDLTHENIQQARNILMDEIHPIDDIRSEAKYRKTVAGNLLTEFLESLKK